MQGGDCISAKARADSQGRYTLLCFVDINIHVFLLAVTAWNTEQKGKNSFCVFNWLLPYGH